MRKSLFLFLLLIVGFAFTQAQQNSWAWVSPYPTGSTINQVHFLTDRVGILVGGNSGSSSSSGGSVLRTTDGGTTWTDVTPDPVLSFGNVSFVDSLRGWLVGNYSGSARVFTTTNGGLTWGLQFAPVSSFYPSDIFFFNNTSGWMVGDYGKIYRTSDGGVTWLDRSIPSQNSLHFYRVRFTSPTNGAALGTGYINGVTMFAAATTTDGGDTWILRATGLSSVLNDLAIRPPSSMVTVGQGGMILQSTNGGSRWFFGMQDLGSTVVSNLNAAAFRDSLTGIAVGTNGVVARTNDGGDSWSQSTVSTGVDLRSVQFFSASEIVVGGSASSSSSGLNPAILISSDGGTTWGNRARYIQNSFSIYSMAFISPVHFWIAGSRYMYETTDSGMRKSVV